MNMKGALPFLAMVVAQIAQVGVTIASMKAIETGMHNFTYIFYSNALASIILLPAVFFIHRSPNRPVALTLSVTGSFLVLGLLGFFARVVGYAANTYLSPAVVTAIYNLLPGFTFLLAVIFGLERLGHGGLAKIIGTLVSVVGALIVTFYAGPAIITSHISSTTPRLLLQSSSNNILGGLLGLITSVLVAFCIILQALILKKFPSVLILVLANCSITAILSLLASLILEHDLNAFSLQSKTKLIVILYTGFFGSGFQFVIEGWCIKIKGPLFVAMFQPLGILIAAIMGFIFLGKGLYLGCIIGSSVIVIGFYGVMWAKAREKKIIDGESSKFPLLQDINGEHNVLQS